MCPLCSENKTRIKLEAKKIFHKCLNCELIFLDKKYHLVPQLEKKRYESHENSDLSEGYRAFLYNIIDPIKLRLSKESNGLDFGSGPHPMMTELLKNEGFSAVQVYDPFFYPDQDTLKQKFDYIIACEVVEHFNNPKESFELIRNCLKDDAFLFIQTSLYDESIDFSSWYYKNDNTHVSFYTEKTINYICKTYGLRINSIEGSVVILKSCN